MDKLSKFFKHYASMFAWAGFAVGMGFAAIFHVVGIPTIFFILAGFGGAGLHYYHFTQIQKLKK